MRLFFAIWPDEGLRKELTTLIESLRPLHPARWIPPEKLHMTLAFLGDIPPERLEQLDAIGSEVDESSDSFVLDRLELWPRPGVLCLVPTVEPTALIALADQLAKRLRKQDFPLERRAFKPHLTLARRAGIRPSYDLGRHPPLAWTPRSLTLMETRLAAGKSGYQVLRSWSIPKQTT